MWKVDYRIGTYGGVSQRKILTHPPQCGEAAIPMGAECRETVLQSTEGWGQRMMANWERARLTTQRIGPSLQPQEGAGRMLAASQPWLACWKLWQAATTRAARGRALRALPVPAGMQCPANTKLWQWLNRTQKALLFPSQSQASFTVAAEWVWLESGFERASKLYFFPLFPGHRRKRQIQTSPYPFLYLDSPDLLQICSLNKYTVLFIHQFIHSSTTHRVLVMSIAKC